MLRRYTGEEYIDPHRISAQNFPSPTPKSGLVTPNPFLPRERPKPSTLTETWRSLAPAPVLTFGSRRALHGDRVESWERGKIKPVYYTNSQKKKLMLLQRRTRQQQLSLESCPPHPRVLT